MDALCSPQFIGITEIVPDIISRFYYTQILPYRTVPYGKPCLIRVNKSPRADLFIFVCYNRIRGDFCPIVFVPKIVMDRIPICGQERVTVVYFYAPIVR